MQKTKFLSVIIPAYRESHIKKDLFLIEKTLEEGLGKEYDFEIICVVDGKVDGTWREAKKAESSKIKAIGYQTNRGKGYALRYGLKAAKGDIAALMDAGSELSPEGLLMALEQFVWNKADMIVGSKRHPESKVNYPVVRRLMSIMYQILTKVLFGLSVSDTQVGLKLIRADIVRKVLPYLTINNYAFDIELLVLVNQLGYKKIYESTVEIHYNFSSLTHASTAKSIFRMFIDTLGVFYRLKILHFYDK